MKILAFTYIYFKSKPVLQYFLRLLSVMVFFSRKSPSTILHIIPGVLIAYFKQNPRSSIKVSYQENAPSGTTIISHLPGKLAPEEVLEHICSTLNTLTLLTTRNNYTQTQYHMER